MNDADIFREVVLRHGCGSPLDIASTSAPALRANYQSLGNVFRALASILKRKHYLIVPDSLISGFLPFRKGVGT